MKFSFLFFLFCSVLLCSDTLAVWRFLHYTSFFFLFQERKCSFLIFHFEIGAKETIVNEIVQFLFLKRARTVCGLK